MRIENKNILITIIAVTLLLFPVIALTTGVLRVILGMFFVIIFPGWALLSALFPRQNDLRGVERFALSLGTSIAIVSVIGLILHYTPWGIGLNSTLISVSIFIIVAGAIGCYRQWKLGEDDRLSFTARVKLPVWGSMGRLNKILSVILGLMILIAIGSLGYTLAAPKQGEVFTEFYILNASGGAQDYPGQVMLGDPVNVIIGVVNHEYGPSGYRVIITVNGISQKEVSTGTLAHEGKYEQEVTIIPHIAGNQSKIEFHLYKDGINKPYFDDPPYLFVDIIAPVSNR